MIPAKYLHKKVTFWGSIDYWANALQCQKEELRDLVMENVDVGYINMGGEFIGPAFEVKTGCLSEVIRLMSHITHAPCDIKDGGRR